jgi:hypothetical protein
VSEDYVDTWITCDARGLHIRGYYFPWGTKNVPYASIKGLRRFDMSALHGKWRIWGTGNVKYWANLDPGRPNKSVGFLVDVGRFVQPFITPSNPDAAEAVIRERAGPGPSDGTSMTAPFV